MITVPIPLSEGRAHRAVVGASLSALGRTLARLVTGRRALVVSAAPVARRHAAPLLRGLSAAGFRAETALIPDGERHKSLDAVRRIYAAALRAGVDRRCPVIALGGGVVGDTAGFAAATFLRGVPLVQAPTTLLAMVDSSVGGKTGVDLPEGKNLVGAFWQPRLIWMDTAVLSTLPDRQWRTGMAEVIKYGLIADKNLLSLLERLDLSALKRDAALVRTLVARSAAIKAGVVARDERETAGARELLNLGHTFGHAIETVTGYREYTHGEAVAVGLAAAARLAADRGALPFEGVARVDRVLSRWGLPCRARRALPRANVLAAMRRDKKATAGRLRFIVPEAWGRARAIDDVPLAEVDRVCRGTGIYR